MCRRLALAGAAAISAALGAERASACDLALLLAVDVSGSVDTREYKLQMQGLADALRDGSVSEALVQAEAAVSVMQWTGSSRQDLSIGWTVIRDFEALERLATEVEDIGRRWRNFATAIGSAMEFAADTFETAPPCRRMVLDVSGDGTSNEGPEPKMLHARLKAMGITVNGLAIEGAEEDLTAYYWENVIFGHGAFVVTADGFDDYPEKIRRKLLKEVVEQVSSSRGQD